MPAVISVTALSPSRRMDTPASRTQPGRGRPRTVLRARGSKAMRRPSRVPASSGRTCPSTSVRVARRPWDVPPPTLCSPPIRGLPPSWLPATSLLWERSRPPERGGCPYPMTSRWSGSTTFPPAATATPPPTTVNQDHARKGLLAGGLLVARLQGEKAPRPDLLPARLVTRGSTGPARKGRPKRRPTR
jgi:hypothetical protein